MDTEKLILVMKINWDLMEKQEVVKSGHRECQPFASPLTQAKQKPGKDDE